MEIWLDAKYFIRERTNPENEDRRRVVARFLPLSFKKWSRQVAAIRVENILRKIRYGRNEKLSVRQTEEQQSTKDKKKTEGWAFSCIEWILNRKEKCRLKKTKNDSSHTIGFNRFEKKDGL